MKSRVLICFPTNSIYGGVEQWLTDICVGLRKEGAKVVLAPARGFRFHIPEKFLNFHHELKSFTKIDIDGSLGIPVLRRKSLKKAIELVRPDVLIPVLLFDGLAAAVSVSRKIKPKIIYPAHENSLEVVRFVNYFRPHIDTVVSVNKLFINALYAWYDWPIRQLWHVRCGVPGPKYYRKLNTKTSIRIGYCGKLNDTQKRVRDIVTLTHHLRTKKTPFDLTIVGDGPEESYLKAAFCKEPELKETQFLGRLNRNELYSRFYPSLDVLIILSEWETGPMVAWEAMQHGVVPVTSRYLGLSAEGLLRDDQNCCIFPVGDTESAAQKISQLARDEVYFKRLSTGAILTARKHLSLETMIKKWLDVIENVMVSPTGHKEHLENLQLKVRYFETIFMREKIRNYARSLLKKPIWHGSYRQEWPPYLPLPENTQENDDFHKRLRMLELRQEHLP